MKWRSPNRGTLANSDAQTRRNCRRSGGSFDCVGLAEPDIAQNDSSIVQDGNAGREHNVRIMRIPLFPLNTVLFPGTALPLHIFEDRYREMVGECLAEEKAFGVVRADGEQMSIVGCAAKIVRVVQRYDDGRMDILCEGGQRFEIEGLDESRIFLQADVEFFDDEGALDPGRS